MYHIVGGKNFENALKVKLGKNYKVHYVISNKIPGQSGLAKSIKFSGLTNRALYCIGAAVFSTLVFALLANSAIPLLLLLFITAFTGNEIRKAIKYDLYIPIALFGITYKIETNGKCYVNKIVSTKDAFIKFEEEIIGKYIKSKKINYEIDTAGVINLIQTDLHVQMRKSPN